MKELALYLPVHFKLSDYDHEQWSSYTTNHTFDCVMASETSFTG